MDLEKDVKDQSVAPADPRKRMIHQWRSSADEASSPDTTLSIIDIGSPLAFSPGMFSIKSPDLLFQKSTPSVSSSWLKSPKSVEELSSEPPSVGSNLENVAQNRLEDTDLGVDGSWNNQGTEHGSLDVLPSDVDKEVAVEPPAEDSAPAGDVEPPETCDVSVKPCTENVDKTDDVRDHRATGDAVKHLPLVCEEAASPSAECGVSDPRGPFGPLANQQPIASSGGESPKDGHVIAELSRCEVVYPVSVQPPPESQQQVACLSGTQSLPHALFFPVKADLIEQSADQSSGESGKPPSLSGSMSLSASRLSCEDEKLKARSEFMSFVMRTQSTPAESRVQRASLASLTNPSVESRDTTFSGVCDSLAQSSQTSVDAFKPFDSELFEQCSAPSEKQLVGSSVMNSSSESNDPIELQESCKPVNKSQAGVTKTSYEPTTTTHSQRFQPYGLRKASSRQTRVPSGGACLNGRPPKRTAKVKKKHYATSRDRISSPVKPNVPQKVTLLNIQNSQLENTSHVDSTEVNKQTCQVCGDISAGFHCGANVCEACKKFFVRCIRQGGGVKFVCQRQQNCEIRKDTRTQCQYCRYQKCLRLGMYKPGGSNISSEIGHIPCKVCSAPSSGYHFGAMTCEGCKGFFRRTIKERDHLKYRCNKGGNCVITVTTRNICKYCRYQKCLSIGMTPAGSRIGRQPNSVRHATLMQLQKIKTMKGLPPDPLLPRPICGADVKEEPKADDLYSHQCGDNIDDDQVCEEVGICLDLDHLDTDNIKTVDQSMASKPDGQSNKPWPLPDQAVMDSLSKDKQIDLDPVCEVGMKSSEISSPEGQSFPEAATSSDGRQFVEDQPALGSQSASDEFVDIEQNVQSSQAVHQSGYPATDPHGFTTAQSQSFLDQMQAVPLPSPSASFNPQVPSMTTCVELPAGMMPSSSSLPPSSSSLFLPVVSTKPLLQPDIVRPLSDVMAAPLTVPLPRTLGLARFTNITTPSTDILDLDSHKAPVSRDGVQSVVDGNPSPAQRSHQHTPTMSTTGLNNSSTVNELNFAVATGEFMIKAPEQLKKIRQRSCPRIEADMTAVETWNVIMSQFNHCAHVTLKFAKMVPGFRCIPIDRQIEAIKQNMFPIVILQLALDYNLATSEYNCFCLDGGEEATVRKHFPFLSYLIPSFHDIGRRVQSLGLTGVEVSFLSGLILAFDAKDGLILENLTNSLQNHVRENNHSQCANKFGKILLILGEFKKLAEVQQKCVAEVAKFPVRYPGIEIPQLFQETFMNYS